MGRLAGVHREGSVLRSVLLALGLALQLMLPGQQRIGPLTEQLPPFSDRRLDACMARILTEMDGFHADSSMLYIGKALQYEAERPDAEVRYYLHSYRAEVLYYEGLFNEAMRDLNVCQEIAAERQDSTMLANVFNMRGLLHENIQDSREALPFLYRALEHFPARPKARYPLTELYHIHGNLGSYLTAVGRLDSARSHLQRSLDLANAAGMARATAVALWSLGNLDLKEGDVRSALTHFTEAVRIADNARDHDIGVDARVGRAEALTALGEPRLAFDVLDSAEHYLDTHRYGIGLVTQRNFVRRASVTYKQLGALDRAIQRSDQWYGIDSLITARNINTALQTQGELLRSDNELALARAQKERIAEDLEREKEQRTVITIASLATLTTLLILLLVLRSRQRAREQLAALDLLRLQQEGTIAELRIREELGRDMHDDLGAGLSALKLRSEMALRMEPDPQKRQLLTALAATAGELITNMRQMIWSMNADQVTLKDLAVYLGNYASTYLDEHGIGLDLNAPTTVPEGLLTAAQRRNMLLVVKESLHNIVKHANARKVHVTITYASGMGIEISDDGIGLPPGADRGMGNGLRNLARRMEAINGTFSVESPVNGTGNGTCLRFHMPLGTNKRSIAASPAIVAPSPA